MVSQIAPTIVVPARLRNPHELVSKASRLLRGRDTYQGLIHCSGTQCLNIAVAPASLGRALRIMNALICALQERGLRVEVTPWLSYEQRRQVEGEDPSNATRVSVSGEWIEFGLTEKRSVARPASPQPPKDLKGTELESWLRWNGPRSELVPNGTLELSIENGAWGTRKSWRDGKRKRLEACLVDFVAHLPAVAAAIRAQRAEIEARQREYQEAERRRIEDELRRREEEELRRRFEVELDRWRFARDAREYLTAIRSVLDVSKAQGTGVEEVLQYLRRMEAVAARVDPIGDIRQRLIRRRAEQFDAEPRNPMKDVAAESGGEKPATTEEVPLE
jgi:hypothetical protein